jgi:fructose/tagatose bisphosphate aldolase
MHPLGLEAAESMPNIYNLSFYHADELRTAPCQVSPLKSGCLEIRMASKYNLYDKKDLEVMMSTTASLEKTINLLGESILLQDGSKVVIQDPKQLRENIENVVRVAILGGEPDRSIASWLVRECALESGVVPSSIHDFYIARGRGEIRDDFTVPAINLRAIPYYAASVVFRTSANVEAKSFIFELARSEMGYTSQIPADYATCILGAAIAEGYMGPVFIQGDHYQVSSKKYGVDPEGELETIRNLALESIRAGFFNIDIDTSTLVDLSQSTIPEQQETNFSLSADLAAFIRAHEPKSITVSLGGEIGEVGGRNSTEPELKGYMEGFNEVFGNLTSGAPGLSKISIQTGTSHGGVVLPDGSIAQVKVDFQTLKELSAVAKKYGMGGAVQHGASTLPEEAFSHFPESNALEVHLATGFQNIMYDRLPNDLLETIYAYLRENHGNERKPDQTDEQFYYTSRKRAIGPFKKELWNLSKDIREEIENAWEKQFALLFDSLNIAGTKSEIEKFIHPVIIHESLASYLGETLKEEDTRDLAD